MAVTQFLVKTDNEEELNRQAEAYMAGVVGHGMPGGPQMVDGKYVVRPMLNANYTRMALESKGYVVEAQS